MLQLEQEKYMQLLATQSKTYGQENTSTIGHDQVVDHMKDKWRAEKDEILSIESTLCTTSGTRSKPL